MLQLAMLTSPNFQHSPQTFLKLPTLLAVLFLLHFVLLLGEIRMNGRVAQPREKDVVLEGAEDYGQ